LIKKNQKIKNNPIAPRVCSGLPAWVDTFLAVTIMAVFLAFNLARYGTVILSAVEGSSSK